jgi:murein L,D-transpeptidase YafK
MKRAALLIGLIVLAGLVYWVRLRLGVYPPPNWERLETQARAFCEERGLPYPLRQPALHIEKGARRLRLLEQGAVVAEFPIALSRASTGHKLREGDRKTPEGDYYVCEKHVSRRFYLFLGLSYPNAADAAAGYRAGRITKEQRQQIESAIRAGQCPPWETPLGGAIGIHGGGAQGDWTLGCIAVDDAHIELLYMLVPIGCPVRIEP